MPIYNEKTGENEYFPLWQRASSKTARSTCVDIMAKYQIDMYAAGLHRRGSKAVERYTNMEIRDDFALRNIAFRQLAQNLSILTAIRIQQLLQFLHFLPETGISP